MVKLLVTDLIRINVLIQSIYTLDLMLVAILNRWRGPFTIDAQIDAVTYRFKKANGSTNNRKVNCSLKVLKFY